MATGDQKVPAEHVEQVPDALSGRHIVDRAVVRRSAPTGFEGFADFADITQPGPPRDHLDELADEVHFSPTADTLPRPTRIVS